MTTALDPAASPQCVFGADGQLRCACANDDPRMWGPVADSQAARAQVQRQGLADAERQQAVLQRQWLWQQQRSVVAAQQRL
jgi:hypothetical protein